MTIEELCGHSAEQLSTLTDDELRNLLIPLFPKCRPEFAAMKEKSPTKAVSKELTKEQQAVNKTNELLKQFGFGHIKLK